MTALHLAELMNIILDDGRSITTQQAINYLLVYSVPQLYEFTENVPKTAS